MGRLADHLAPKELHEQRWPFHWHGVNFDTALTEAEALGMDDHFAALTQFLAAYAQNQRDFASADRRFSALADHYKQRDNPKGQAAAYHQLGGSPRSGGILRRRRGGIGSRWRFGKSRATSTGRRTPMAS